MKILRPPFTPILSGITGTQPEPPSGFGMRRMGSPGAGDYPLNANTAHSIELNVEVFIPEWDRSVRIMLEEDAFFDGERVDYIDGRMTEFYLIPRP